MLRFFLYFFAGNVFVFLSFSPLYAYSSVPSGVSILRKHIISYNLMHHKRILSDGSYRGEEGILLLRPEAARLLGLKVLMNEDFLRAEEEFEKAESSFVKAVKGMTTKRKERYPEENTKIIYESSLAYNRLLESAKKALMSYRSAVTHENDDRLKKALCINLLDKLLLESIERESFNLRDALASFFNRCHNSNEHGAPLHTGNTPFVNHVFNHFIKEAPSDVISQFDLDRCGEIKRMEPVSGYDDILTGRACQLAKILTPVIEKHNKGNSYPVDLLLFLALMRQESAFKPHEISHVGAVGLTQIMPRTAKNLGMKNIFEPAYFVDARHLMRKERRLRQKALALIPKISSLKGMVLSARARSMMQESLAIREMARRLFVRYKKEVLVRGDDDRLDTTKAIKFGLEYFGKMLIMTKGDISLALASYNAGPHRVREFGGIPPFSETVSFRNKVLRYYQKYLEKLDQHRSAPLAKR